MSREVAIASAARTAVGRINWALSDVNVSELVTTDIQKDINRANL